MNARPWFLRCIVFAIALCAFARLSSCKFALWDDQLTIYENPLLNPPTWNTLRYYWTTADTDKTMGLYVPVTYTVWAGLAAVNQLARHQPGQMELSPTLFHSLNVLLHSITALLVFELLLRLFAAPIPAALGALLFCVDPVQVEAVGWASGTKDLLCGMFSTASLLMYVQAVQLQSANVGRPPSVWAFRRRYLLGLLLFVLAELSKPTAVVVPLMAGVISVLLLNRSIWRTIASLVPWLVLMPPFLILTRLTQPFALNSPLPGWASVLVAADALAFYCCKIVFPLRLGVDYGRTPAAILASHQIYFTWILTALIIALLVLRQKRARPAVAAALLFALPLAPVLGFVPFDFQRFSTTADHYLYMPMLGVAVLATWVLKIRQTSGRGWRLTVWLAFAIIAVFSLRSIQQEHNWKDSTTLFSHALAVNPRSVPAAIFLGYQSGHEATELKKQGKIAEARALFDRSTAYFRRTLEVDPDATATMFYIALNYRESGQRKLGIEMVHRIIDAQQRLPAFEQADVLTVAELLQDFGDLPGEIKWLQQAQKRDPANRQIAQRLVIARTKFDRARATRSERSDAPRGGD